jgi:hypothetical protein
MFASKSKGGGDDMTKARLLYLLVFAALLAFYLGCYHGHGPNDGGWIL